MCSKFNFLQFITDLFLIYMNWYKYIFDILKIVWNIRKFFRLPTQAHKVRGRSEKLYFEPRNHLVYDIKNVILLDLCKVKCLYSLD